MTKYFNCNKAKSMLTSNNYNYLSSNLPNRNRKNPILKTKDSK